MTVAGLVLAGLAGLALLVARLHELLHLLQLEHYELARLRVWIDRRRERFQPRELGLVATVAALVAAGSVLGGPALTIAAGAVGVVFAGLLATPRLGRRQAKPLVFTARARRLFAVALVLEAAGVVAAALVGGMRGEAAAIAGAGLAVVVAHVYTDVFLGLAGRVLAPLQAIDNGRYERRARARLRAVAPEVVGVTGSYGKTTTKVCITAVAALRGPAYPTPASFNSRLGVIRAINEGLEGRHRTFVVEMGAYRAGDIAELCELVEPSVGVLTAIGPAHLERFGSLAAIERAKGELGAALPSDGLFVTRADDEACRRAAERADCRTVLFAPDPHPDADVFAETITLAEGRTRFTLCLRGRQETERVAVRAQLLGRHNVANLLAAAAYGFGRTLPAATIARALAGVAPPAHRLAPIVNQAAGIVVIDDAYNANPEGAAAALDVLGAHPAQRRLLVTPGMVELGEREVEENVALGARAAAICDLVILVGDLRTRPIREGLERQAFPAESVVVVEDSAAAAELLARTTQRGDVVLFENDLPDLYSAG